MMSGSTEPNSPPKIAPARSENCRATTRSGTRVLKLAKLLVLGLAVTVAVLVVASPAGSRIAKLFGFDREIENNAERMLAEGRQTFRFDTFGDEAFWGGMLQLHQAIEGSEFGGVGPGLSPAAALGVGLKVDVDALPSNVVQQIRHGRVDLSDPAVTLLLLRHDAVVGVKGFFNSNNSLNSVGITCAFCHSTVDDSLTTGIGHRLDGWANRDLNIGEIVALAPNLSPFSNLLGVSQDTVRTVLRSWGPGKFDAE
jgi:hypothetical protein